jgi:CubicO group peptidase (beta-lactamase class C family)
MNNAMKVIAIAVIGLMVSINSVAQMPMQDGAPHAPDSWLMWSGGRAWSHRITPSPKPAKIDYRTPTATEQVVVERVKALMDTRPAKAFALVDGDTIVYQQFNAPANADSRFFGFSIGKTATAMAVGQAICANRLRYDTKAKEWIPKLDGQALGEATVHDLLRMSSGTSDEHTVAVTNTPENTRAWNNGTLNIADLVVDEKVASAKRGVFSNYRPGEVFSYKSTDPNTLAIMVANATGMPWAQWLQQQVFDQMGAAKTGQYELDNFKNGEAAAGVRLELDDWVRFSVWIKRSSAEPGCFGDFVRRAMKRQISTTPANSSGDNGMAGYGYFMWTDLKSVPGSVWGIGYGGQRIGWNTDPANRRMVIVFSSVENWSRDVYDVARDWMRIK